MKNTLRLNAPQGYAGALIVVLALATLAASQTKDGTNVSMFIVHRQGLKYDGANPALLYGYGGFNVSQTPAFNRGVNLWLERGGVYAVANLRRGGGEYGEGWHKRGMLAAKQNGFDDFIAAALQAANNSANPILLRVETKAGHGAGKPLTEQIAEATDVWSFLFWQLGVSA